MPPRAFPYPFKLGIDICHIPRVKSILLRNVDKGEKQTRPLSRFLSKVLTWPERQYFWDRFKDHDAAYKDISKVSQYLAGRWAAKEACRKACTHMGMSNGLHHIIILPISTPETAVLGASSFPPKGLILRESLHPYFTTEEEVSNAAKRVRLVGAGRSFFNINEVDGQFCEVSISHDATFAQAVAMVPHMEDMRGSEKLNTFKSVHLSGPRKNVQISDDFDTLADHDYILGGDEAKMEGVPLGDKQDQDFTSMKANEGTQNETMGEIIARRKAALDEQTGISAAQRNTSVSGRDF